MTALPIESECAMTSGATVVAEDGPNEEIGPNALIRNRAFGYSGGMPPRKVRTDRRDPASDNVTPEAAVRLYLEYLASPDSFDNSAQVESLAKRAESTKDVLQKLTLLRDSRRAQAGVAKEFRANFIRLAKRYADEQDLAAEDFRTLGVSSAVLTEAGLVSRGRGGRRARGEGTSSGRVGSRSTSELATIREWASANGYKVSTRGRIAADITAAYEAAQ